MRLVRSTRSLLLTVSLVGFGSAAEAKPKINFSTFLGGPEVESSVGIAVDADRRSFVLSSTHDPERFAGGPTLLGPGGERDLVVTRLDKRGRHERSVAFGGSDFDHPLAIALGPDPSGESPHLVYVLGVSFSNDFPTWDPIQAACAGSGDCSGDLTITILDLDLGEIVFSTFLGGTEEDGLFFFDRGGDLAVNEDGSIAVVSSTASKKGYPTRRPTQKKAKGDDNAVVSVLQPVAGGGYRIAFSTYLGGVAKKTVTFAHAVAFGPDGLLYVVGSTDDRRFPGMAPLQEGSGGKRDGFLAVYDLEGEPRIVHSTLFGGRDLDWFFDVAVEKNRIYVAGTSRSPDFPLTNPFQLGLRGISDALLAVFDIGPTLSSGAPPFVVVSTLFGGRQLDVGYALAVDRKGIVHFVGDTFSRDLPTRSPVQAQCAPHPSATPDCWDGFVARFEPIENGAPPELRFGTFLGGGQSGGLAGGEVLTDVTADNKGASYVAGRTGSPGYPTRRAVQKTLRGGLDGCVTNIKK